MPRNIIMIAILTVLTVGFVVRSQAQTNPWSRLDGSPYDPATDPDIDLFISNWRDSMPRHHHGNLVVRDILIPLEGEPLRPERRGAVCMVVERLSRVTLQPGERTTPATLTDTQEIYYIVDGRGTITGGGAKAELYEGVGILMPPGVEFSFACDGEPLEMYLVIEPVPAGFTPRGDMLVRDENVLPMHTTTGHWTHINKRLFRSEDGLATLSGMGPVWFEGNTMGQPHSHPAESEEIWFSVEGDPKIFVGKQIRDFSPGTAYKIPANGATPHSTINTGTEPVKVFWMMRGAPGSEPEPYSRLEPGAYDPATDPDYAMFMGSWLDNHSYATHGALVERDILTRGDPDHPARKGAVLRYVNRFTRAMLHPHGSTLPTTLDGEQEIFYILSGQGKITDGQSTAELHPGIAVLMPPGLAFTMTNTSDDPLTMYLISEPVPADFKPLGAMKVADESRLSLNTGNPHWVGCSKTLFSGGTGLATLTSVLTVRLDTNTFFHPHSHGSDIEEVWTTISGDMNVLLGKKIFTQPAGTAYNIPPDRVTPHGNFNVSDGMGMMFYFSLIPSNR